MLNYFEKKVLVIIRTQKNSERKGVIIYEKDKVCFAYSYGSFCSWLSYRLWRRNERPQAAFVTQCQAYGKHPAKITQYYKAAGRSGCCVSTRP